MARVVLRGLLIVLLGATLGFVSNQLNPKRIPIITPPRPKVNPEEFVALDKAHELWQGGNVLFFDARKPEDFQAGHIANALNLPSEDFEQHFPQVAPMLSADSAIIVYCDGTECELSHHLAGLLRPQGYTNIHILSNGWTAWRTAGFPVETNSVK
jgi:rhodanese-related sulfurtransferase